MIAYVGMIVSSVLCMKTSELTAVAMALMLYLFESGAFSIIFAISLRGMGRHTKTAASLQATAIGGGAFLPLAQRAVSLTRGIPYSYSVLVAIFSAGAVFPLYLNLVPAAKGQVDPVPDEYIRRRDRPRPTKQNVVHRESENESSGGVLSRRRSVFSAFKFPGGQTVQHRE